MFEMIIFKWVLEDLFVELWVDLEMLESGSEGFLELIDWCIPYII